MFRKIRNDAYLWHILSTQDKTSFQILGKNYQICKKKFKMTNLFFEQTYRSYTYAYQLVWCKISYEETKVNYPLFSLKMASISIIRVLKRCYIFFHMEEKSYNFLLEIICYKSKAHSCDFVRLENSSLK